MKSITHYWQNLNYVSLTLAPFSLLFCFLVTLRRFFYRVGLFKTSLSPLPVIVVGNIYIGGNGKTPFVIWLAEQLKEAGYKPGIVSRGYGASADGSSPTEGSSWPRRVDLQQDVQLFGDEPFLIHQSTHCPVVVDPDRSRAVDKLAGDTDCDVIISDDGLQHYAMSRFIEINITDAGRLYGNGLCLPAGPLRERKSRLKSVDYIVYNVSRAQLNFPEQLKKTMQQTDDKEFFMEYDFLTLKALSGQTGRSMTLSDFKNKTVHAVAGIGDPGQFFKLLRRYGIKVIEHPFADHYQYQQEDFVFDDSYPIIMTEKDAVKCHSFLLTELSDSWCLPIKARVDNALINKITQQLGAYQINT